MNMVNVQERIAHYSVSGLQPAVELTDILTMLVGTDKKSEVINDLASRGAKYVSQMTVEEFIEAGLTNQQALKLHAASLFMQKVQVEKENRFIVRTAFDAATYLMPEMGSLQQEHFVALFLSNTNSIIHKKTMFVGSHNNAVVSPREVYRDAVKCNANSIIISHNHPGKNMSASPDDISLTKRFIEAGTLLGIPCKDHIIVSENGYISMKEKGYLIFPRF